MTTDPRRKTDALGFLTVLEDGQFGLFGGYLLLNSASRPLEFHCTSPIKPNRAQQILYGPTLEPYLYGEQIGTALVRAARLEPLVVWTDRSPALALRSCISRPVALVLPDGPDGPPAAERAGQAAEPLQVIHGSINQRSLRGEPESSERLAVFSLGRNRLAVGRQWVADQQQIEHDFGPLAEWFDLSEPFTRIRLAIEEARRAAQAA